MREKINKYIDDINNIVISNQEDANNFTQKYLTKKGILNKLFLEFKTLSTDEKKAFGQSLNELKKIAVSKINISKTSRETPQNKNNI